MIKRLLIAIITLHGFLTHGQCDVAITDVNLETYEVTVEVINSEGCLPAPIGGVSGAVTMLQIGYHLPEAIDPDNEVVDLLTLPNAPCSPQWVDNGYTLGMVPTSNHPGWWYSPSVSNTFDADLMGANGLTTGDVVVIPLNPPGDYVTFPYPLAECGDDLIDYWLSEGECIEFVVWQLNYGSSWYTANGGWAESANGYVPNPSTYQDQNCDNSWYMCRDENPGAPVANPDVCDVYPLDIQVDSVWVTDAACDIYNIGACDAGLEWAFSYTNVGEEPIPSWYFEITGPNGYYTTTTDLYGLSANPPYDNALLPGESNIIINTNGNAWVGGTELCVNSIIYDTDEPELGNNAFCITLPPLPDCCTDPPALNFAPDAIVSDIEFEIGCIGDLPAYRINYIIYNIGNDTITDYCIELWNEDYYQCFDSDLFGAYEIPPGEGQFFSTPFFEFSGNPGGFFVVSVDSVNDEIVTGNNNTTVYYPDELGDLICPEECEPDTVEVITYIYQVDSIFTPIYETDTLYVELPQDTIIEYVDNFIFDTTYVNVIEYVDNFIFDTTYIEIPVYQTDTIYVENIDTIYVEIPIYITDTITETQYVTDTIFITTVDTITKYEYVYLTDTLYEYIYIDCETGLECIEDPGLDCPDWTSIYIPNTFTPNNDGINDVFMMIYDLNCWVDVEFKIFNRWGVMIYEGEGDSFDSYPYWDGSILGGSSYAIDGVYTYTFYAKKTGTVEVYRKSGHISLFR